MDKRYLLEVEHLQISFPPKGIDPLCSNKVVEDISFQLERGEILGIVGESGSGKTMTALSIIGLLSESASIQGSIFFQGRNLLALSEKESHNYKGVDISMIFQEPMTSLNPVLKVGRQVEEMLKNHSSFNRGGRRERTIQMLEEVGLRNPEELYEKYPHQLSGGMRQRVMIAIAMICKPKLLLADEPTTALDVTVQDQILKLIQGLCRSYGTSVIFISHDLGVVKSICSRTLVLCGGRIVEEGEVEELFLHPVEEYTKKLLEAVPGIHNRRIRLKNRIPINNRHPINDRNSSDNKGSVIDLGQAPAGGGITHEVILKVVDLSAYYIEKKKSLFSAPKKRQILNQVSLELKRGEILGIVGESGCGKTTLAKAVVGLAKDVQGEVQLGKARPQMVFQDPFGSLNPVKKIGWILEEPLKIKGGFSKKQRKEKVLDLLRQVGLNETHIGRLLSELSGGQRQRVGIACALMRNADFIILDEPVSALDVTVQAQILDLLLSLREQHHLSYLFISHDLNVVRQMCDRVCVMHQGRIVETAEVEQLYRNPKHEYSKLLIASNRDAGGF